MIKVLVVLLLVWMLIIVILPAVDIPNTVLTKDAGGIFLALLFGICALASRPLPDVSCEIYQWEEVEVLPRCL